jgi:hypothetical protein
MDPFSYLVVLTSIVLALAVTRVVGGLGQLMQKRKRRRSYWVHTLWLLNLLLVIVIVWWFAYRWRTYERWTFFLFLWLLLSPIVLYLIASLLFPDPDDEQPITDWRIISTRIIGTFFFSSRSFFRSTSSILCSRASRISAIKARYISPPWAFGSRSALSLPSTGARNIMLSLPLSFSFTISACSELHSSRTGAFPFRR